MPTRHQFHGFLAACACDLSRSIPDLGRPLAQRLLADGEHVVDAPGKLAARARALDTGHGRKTDAQDAHSVAVAAVGTKNLRVLVQDGELEAMHLPVERREELAAGRSRPEAMRCPSDGSPTRSFANSSPTPTEHTDGTRTPTKARVREGTAGRLKNPARSTCPRTSTLRISHIPDPSQPSLERHCPLRLDTEGSR